MRGLSLASANLIFHLIAVIAFLAMGLGFVRAKARERLVHSLLAQRCREKRSTVDWPALFIGRFAGAFQIPLLGRVVRDGAPIRIQPTPWVELHLTYGISAIHLTFGVPWQVAISVAQCPEDISLWTSRLAESLGGRVQATIEVD